uniref:Calmodulin-like protein 4 n=1 Tax=Xenopus tropicalis TaxID=8364 RepID=A0A5S6L4X6_XENTR
MYYFCLKTMFFFLFQVSKANGKGLEALTSMVIQKFPILTPKIFIDLAQFIPFMSVSDIVNFPPSLLANQSVILNKRGIVCSRLDAIRIYSPDMKLAQKRAFAKRLMQANMFGDISSWPPYFLRSIQPLLPYLPFCHFVQLTPDQIKLLADGWNDVKLEMVQGRHVALSLMNTSRDNTEDQLQSLGSFSCYLTYEDLEDILPLQYPLRQLEKNLLECINEGIISPFGRPTLDFIINHYCGIIGAFSRKCKACCFPSVSNSTLGSLANGIECDILQQLNTIAEIREVAIYLHGIPSGLHKEINVEELNLLGPLIGYVGEENVAHINRRHLLLNLEELASYCLSDEFISQLGNMLTEEDMLGYLSVKKTLYNTNGVTNAREELLFSGYSSVKNDLPSTEPIPTCADMRVTFPSAWTAAQITGMAASEFEDCLGLICRDTELTGEQARAALAKIKQLFGPVKTMSPVLILQMGNLPMHINDKELQEMEIPDWGVVSYLSHMENWTPKQMRILVSSILRQTRKTASDLDLTELTALGHLICGLGVEDLKKINTREFSQAAVFVGTLKLKCSETQLETLAELLTSSSAFGVVSRWGPEIFTEIGTLAAGLPDIVLSSVIRDQIKGLTPSAISLIPAQKFAVVFSPAQLSVFTSDQAAAVTPEQYDHLNYQQRQAISTAKYEGDVHQDPRGPEFFRPTWWRADNGSQF